MAASKFSGPFMKKSPMYKKDPDPRKKASDTIRVSKKYKAGDFVSEDDLDKATKKTVSGQDYSKVKVDKKGPYVTYIGDKLED
jgi:hypothetical protein